MKHKKKISLLLALALGTVPILSNVTDNKTYAQTDWDGSLPYYLQVEIEELYKNLTPEEVAFLRKTGYANVRAFISALNLVALAYHGNPYITGAIEILINRIYSYID